MIGYDAWHWMPTQEEIEAIATAIAQERMGPDVKVQCHIVGLLPPPSKDAARNAVDQHNDLESP